ncbi:MAG: T9SS type A sorting domain-containing protein [Elusimicrobiaceae bacterium]|nr:T9SS type A sorting domain-containing protein [Elusimicrobiaceae bacterium]MBQ6224570.1 T9SS type A sorting domain-containing protein [Campylobacter sp.]
MKRFIALAALVFFAAGLNATLTKEELYQVAPAEFKQMKKELNSLNTKQTEELKKAFINKKINEAFKAVFLNKDILNNSNSVLVKDGKVIQSSKAADAQGVYFWHEFNANLENPPAENTCVINNGTWEDGYADSTCGMIKYRMDYNSPFASITDKLYAPGLYLLPDVDFSEVENIIPGDIGSQEDALALRNLAIHMSTSSHSTPDYEIRFESLQTVTDTPVAIGYINSVYPDTLVKPISPWHVFSDMDKFSTYYRPTESTYQDRPIYTLKSGNYLQLLVLSYNAGEDSSDGFYVFFKWFKLKVENYYLGDVGVNNYNLNNLAKITYNNQQVIIDLEEEINPTTTTYELYDISGRLIQSKKLHSSHTKIFVPSVSNGVYIVRLKGKNLNLSKKINVAR